VKGSVTYMVMDDLVVKPLSTISGVTLVSKFGVTDLGAVEEKVVHFGIDEVYALYCLKKFLCLIKQRKVVLVVYSN
jgi:hypothetical protein